MSAPLFAISNASIDPAVLPDAVAGLRILTRQWSAAPSSFVLQTFEHPPSGAGAVTLDEPQSRILSAVSAYDRVAVRTGRGVGKTATAALIVHWWLSTRYPALVVTSAGTWGHLEDKLWPEILQWGRHWLLREGFEYQTMGIYSRENPQGHRAEATSSDQPVNVEGYHSPHLLILIDEAKGMPDEIFDALLASLTGNEEQGLEQKLVALSTPPLTKQGWFARVSSSSEWKVVHVSGLESSRVSRSYISEILSSYGEDSPQYQSFVLGNIPESTSETVVPLAWIEAAQQLAPCPPKRATKRPVLTCDVAREGDDLCTFGVIARAAFSLVQFPDGCRGWTAKKSLTETVARCIQAAALYPDATAICIDDTGLGGGVTDMLREKQHQGLFPKTIAIIPIKFGSKPANGFRFDKLKDELWWTTREALREQRLALPSDDDIRSWQCPRGSDFKLQLSAALYEYDSLDRINVLDKRKSGNERTKTLPTKSPDLAHALILGVRYYMRQGRMEEIAEEPPATQEDVLGRVLRRTAVAALRPRPTDPYRRQR